MSDLYLDVKYCNQLSNRLDRFKVKKSSPYVSNFRCPFCGDSQKNKYKARAYLFQHKGDTYFKCYNCGLAHGFTNFLKKIDNTLYREYIVEKFKDRSDIKPKEQPKQDIARFTPPAFLKSGSPLRKLKKISQLTYDHPAKKYILSRKIENKHHAKLFYCTKFAEWTNSMIPEKFDLSKGDEPRLIIPFLDEKGNMFGYQGRSFNPNTNLRYITIMFDDRPKIFGLDTVDKNKRTYCFEGPLDSIFIPNSIAMCGADVTLDKSFVDAVYVFDNEPRNKEIVKRIDKMIDKGYSIVIWDDTFKGKDINDMILNGADIEHITIVLEKRTFSGLEARVELMKWKKV